MLQSVYICHALAAFLGSHLKHQLACTGRLQGLQFLITRETQDDPPQYYIKTLATEEGEGVKERQLSNFPHPHPTLRNTRKEIIRYKRADGLDLTATLYTPPGHDKDRDGPLPCILWAYPREFKSKVPCPPA